MEVDLASINISLVFFERSIGGVNFIWKLKLADYLVLGKLELNVLKKNKVAKPTP